MTTAIKCEKGHVHECVWFVVVSDEFEDDVIIRSAVCADARSAVHSYAARVKKYFGTEGWEQCTGAALHAATERALCERATNGSYGHGPDGLFVGEVRPKTARMLGCPEWVSAEKPEGFF